MKSNFKKLLRMDFSMSAKSLDQYVQGGTVVSLDSPVAAVGGED